MGGENADWLDYCCLMAIGIAMSFGLLAVVAALTTLGGC
jgi:hypothetical protein